MDVELGVRIVLFVSLVGTGVLLIWVARAGAAGRLKRNASAGIRTSQTLVSDEAWLAAHVHSKRANTLAGVAAAVTGLLALLPVSAPVLAALMLIGCAAVVGFVLFGSRAASRAAAEASRSAE